MYDFANSAFTTLVVTFVYATYFTKAIAPDVISGTVLWSRAITVSSLVIALTTPFLGALADAGQRRKTFLLTSTAVAVFCSVMLYHPLPGQVYQALFWFVLGNVAFETGCVFYNAFLPEVAPPDKIGSVSGIGWALGYLGGLAAMFIAMATMVNPETPWFGLSRELGQNIRATNILVALWFAVFSIPFFLFVREGETRAKSGVVISFADTCRDLWATMRDVGRLRDVFRFLVARLLYNDGLITIFAFGGIYAAGTFAFTFQEIMVFGIVLNVAAGLGALVFGFVDDRLGSRNTVQISLVGLTVAALTAVFATEKSLFWLAGILVGVFAGPNQSASRSLMARIVPPDQKSRFFGFYAFSGKFTSFLGPLFLGLLTSFSGSQRVGFSVVIVFFVVGGWLLAGVKEGKNYK
ncbi:MAG: MFS transporter [Proteobacteria bacterium]|nr:MFS transporter [Pseudomonadota bacterium]MBU1737668.1 MFS transporter [Pseudomonadota bacterium]